MVQKCEKKSPQIKQILTNFLDLEFNDFILSSKLCRVIFKISNYNIF